MDAFEQDVGSDECADFVAFVVGGSGVVVFIGIEYGAVVSDGVVGGWLLWLEVGGEVSNESEFAECFDFRALHSPNIVYFCAKVRKKIGICKYIYFFQ